MPVQWRTSAPRPVGPQFIAMPPDRIVRVLTSPAEHSVLMLHWLTADRSSFPCLGEVCTHCKDKPPFPYAYAPALVWSDRMAKWMQGILPLGNPTGTCAATDFTETAIRMGRGKGQADKNRFVFLGTVREARFEMPKAPVPFEIRGHLLRRWGLFAEADLIGCELHVPELTLQFPESEVG